MATPKKKNPQKGGRKPFKCTDKVLEMAYKGAAVGLSNQQIAMKLGVAEGTLYDLFKRFPELQESINAGRSAAVENITNALYENALQGNTAAQIFFLKNRAKWSDKQEIEHSGETTVRNIEVKFIDAD